MRKETGHTRREGKNRLCVADEEVREEVKKLEVGDGRIGPSSDSYLAEGRKEE